MTAIDRIIRWLHPVARQLPEWIERPLRSWYDRHSATPQLEDPAYKARVAEETAIFAEQQEVHDLPAIFHYWSNKYLRPQLEAFGFSNPDEFFAHYLAAAHADARAANRRARFASLGCGNCDTEVRVARLLVARGIEDFTIDCVDINEAMLARGRQLAVEAGVSAQVVAAKGDFNCWRPATRYDAVIANQSLHHVVNLEGLFAAIDASLHPEGRFMTSDMIGRNGHMRWPEAMALVHEYWRELPHGYRWNVQLRRHEEMLEQWDCSGSGFEGIRAQDILPLLLARFEFELFIGYGNLVDPFIDRSFGPHFDADAAWDRDFIDRVHARDETEMLAGRNTPTHMIAVLRRRPYTGLRLHRDGLPAHACLHSPATA
jgi:SAM-dependent methyltransferase